MRVANLAYRGEPAIVTVEVDTSPAYELLMSLATFSRREVADTFEVGPAWFERTAAAASPTLLADIERFGVHTGKMWCHFLGLAYEAEARDVATFLAHLETTGPLEIRLHMMGYYLEAVHLHRDVPPELIRAAARGDAAAQQQYLDAACDDESRPITAGLLALTPEENKRQALDVLRRWYDEVFRHQEPEVVPVLAHDAAAKRELIGTMPAERLIDLATNGIRYSAEPGIRRVILIPSVAYRPWVLISEHRDARILCYPVADESFAAEGTASPARLVRLYKALADERRLEALKKLAAESCTLQEMADYLGIGKSLMHHHLATLRAAGLVRVGVGPDKRYELRTDVLDDVSDLLGAYLTGQPAGAAPPARSASRGASSPRRIRRPSA